jgi:hypothetical protein
MLASLPLMSLFQNANNPIDDLVKKKNNENEKEMEKGNGERKWKRLYLHD